MVRVLLRLVVFGVVAVAAPARAVAQPAAAPAVDKKQVARQYTEAGLAAAKIGDWDTAISFYSKAYQLVPHPTLIFNMAEAHRFAGRGDQALTLYRRYLVEAPNGPQVLDARDGITAIEAAKAEAARKAEDERQAARRAEDERQAARRAEDDRKAAAARKAQDDRKAAAARKSEDDREAAAAGKPDDARGAREPGNGGPPNGAASSPPTGAPGAASQADAIEAPAPPGRNLRIGGIAAAASGAVGLGAGIGYALHARSLSNELSRPGAMYDPKKVDAGHRADTIAIVGIAGGTALVAAGAALYWWGYTQGRGERLSVAPMVEGRAVGVVFAGTWP